MLVAGAMADYDGGYSTDFGNQLSGGYSGGGYSDGGGHSGGTGYSGGGGYSDGGGHSGGTGYTGGSDYSGGGGYSGGSGYSGDGGHTGGNGLGGHEEDHHQAHPYEFGYAVKDPHHGTDFGQQESSDGHNVKGSYRVVLPDGRTQIVTYHADWKTGFHADVRYEGTATYPEPQHQGGGNGGGNGGYGYPSQDLGGQDYTAQDHGFSGYSR
ncbi:unnamed protein product [Nezara viridula]|uniref:Pro-resilin n=1 Tax=Nezara viridula TaxID=85310 RepID=A0A9P0H618_NEZVI|nr:unnamed protein product [Nezara viridula]